MHDTPNERLRRRRVRRWKRRARILGPFLGLPLLLIALSLSVDLVEYQPNREPDRLSDRSIRMTRPATTRTTPKRSLVTTTWPTSSFTIPEKNTESIHLDARNLDLMLSTAALLQPPVPSSATK